MMLIQITGRRCLITAVDLSYHAKIILIAGIAIVAVFIFVTS